MTEVTVRHDTVRSISLVAQRIEQAYERRGRRARFRRPAVDPRLWDDLARGLAEAHRRSPWLPIDPELFAAAQPAPDPLASPWVLLQPRAAIRRYRRRVRALIVGLRREVADEIRTVHARCRAGEPIEAVVSRPSPSLSPLGRYAAALRLDRPDLAARLRPAAQRQHADCPLYRPALRNLIDPAAYPALELLPGLAPTPRVGPPCQRISRN